VVLPPLGSTLTMLSDAKSGVVTAAAAAYMLVAHCRTRRRGRRAAVSRACDEPAPSHWSLCRHRLGCLLFHAGGHLAEYLVCQSVVSSLCVVDFVCVCHCLQLCEFLCRCEVIRCEATECVQYPSVLDFMCDYGFFDVGPDAQVFL